MRLARALRRHLRRHGWTWETVGRLTLPRLRALYARFRTAPPPALVLRAIAASLGWEPEPPQEEPEAPGSSPSEGGAPSAFAWLASRTRGTFPLS